MKFQLNFDFPPLENKIEHPSFIFLIGSCFADNISTLLSDLKYNVLNNPHGILYNAQSMSNAIKGIVNKKEYTDADLIERDGLFQCYDFHSSFSGADKTTVLEQMNASILNAHEFLTKAEYVVITLGTSYVYKHLANDAYISNNHKMPATEFTKELLSTAQNEACLKKIMNEVKSINPTAQFIFTVSPVRHIRDGVIENNVSKAHLLSAVHSLKHEGYYFPAYELVTDVLRDYRFYKKDLVHPNGQAIQYVWESFLNNCLSKKDEELRIKIKQLNSNISHKPLHESSKSHRAFLASMKQQVEDLQKNFPHLNWDAEQNKVN